MLAPHFVLLLLAQSPSPPPPPSPSLELILLRLGEAETQLRASPPPCTFRETMRVEELDGSGRVWGWESRVAEVEHRGDFHAKPLEVARGGHEVDGRLRPKRDEELSEDEKAKRRDFRTAFHGGAQPRYRFELRETKAPGQVAVWFEPREPSPERFKGLAVVDPQAMRIVSIDQQLSQLPALLWSFDMHMDFENTACGEQVSRVNIKGSGGFLFIRKFFRSFVERHEFRSLPADAGAR